MRVQNKLLTLGLIALSIFLLGLTAESKTKRAKLFKVAIIDSGFGFETELNKKAFKICKTGSFDFISNLPMVGDDELGHGTSVMGLVNRRANTKNMCFLVYKVFGSSPYGDSNNIRKAMVAAYRNGAKVINMSLGGNQHSIQEREIIKEITGRGVKIFVAAGNASKNLNVTCNSYPVCYKNLNMNLIPVGATDEDVDVAKYSNRGVKISVYKYGRTISGSRGTSFAAPRATGDYIKSLNLDKKSK